MLTEQEVIDRLRFAIEHAGGQRAFAEKHGFTPGYINDVLWRKRGLADRILTTLGIERLIVYRVIDQESKEQ